MIRVTRASVASSVQDQGRTGYRALGHARSGAMDPLSLLLTNRCAGAAPDAAGIELGPGPCAIETARDGVIAFGGARRDGAPWWQTITVRSGERFDVSAPRDGVWSYVCVRGGIDAPVTYGSRSTCVREGIGAWIAPGDAFDAGTDDAEPAAVEPPPMSGNVRIFGSLRGSWRVGTRADRMGYSLDGEPLTSGAASEWSEPLLPGFIQVPPGGAPIVLMAEGPTVGGYPVAAIVHSEDLRLVAQTRAGSAIVFVEV